MFPSQDGKGRRDRKGKTRNLEDGSSVDQSFKSGERFERIIFDERLPSTNTKSGDSYVFMDMESLDQVYPYRSYFGRCSEIPD